MVHYKPRVKGSSYRTVLAGQNKIGAVENLGKRSGQRWVAWFPGGDYRAGFPTRAKAARELLEWATRT